MNEEDFFWPANIDTTFVLWGLEPRHIKRLWPVPFLVAGLGYLAYLLCQHVPLHTAWRMTLYTWCALAPSGGYIWYFCIPRYPRGRTTSDLSREVRRHQRAQTRFPFQTRPTMPVTQSTEVNARA